jgi:hypothetical protein
VKEGGRQAADEGGTRAEEDTERERGRRRRSAQQLRTKKKETNKSVWAGGKLYGKEKKSIPSLTCIVQYRECCCKSSATSNGVEQKA